MLTDKVLPIIHEDQRAIFYTNLRNGLDHEMGVVRQDRYLLNRKATLRRHAEPILCQRLSKGRIKDSSAVPRSKN